MLLAGCAAAWELLSSPWLAEANEGVRLGIERSLVAGVHLCDGLQEQLDGKGGKREGLVLDAVVRRVFVATIGAEADRSKHRALVLRRVEEQSSATPYVQLWSMSTQFQLTSKANIEAAYSDQHGVHLFTSPHDTNVPALSALVNNIKAHADFSSSNTTRMAWAR
jgi:hypothetical protein